MGNPFEHTAYYKIRKWLDKEQAKGNFIMDLDLSEENSIKFNEFLPTLDKEEIDFLIDEKIINASSNKITEEGKAIFLRIRDYIR